MKWLRLVHEERDQVLVDVCYTEQPWHFGVPVWTGPAPGKVEVPGEALILATQRGRVVEMQPSLRSVALPKGKRALSYLWIFDPGGEAKLIDVRR